MPRNSIGFARVVPEDIDIKYQHEVDILRYMHLPWYVWD